LALLSGVIVFLLTQFRPGLMLSDTTATGGDIAAHIYTPWYLRHNLLPRGLLTGWSPGWYAGFPLLHFYFPLVATLQALMSFVSAFEERDLAAALESSFPTRDTSFDAADVGSASPLLPKSKTMPITSAAPMSMAAAFLSGVHRMDISQPPHYWCSSPRRAASRLTVEPRARYASGAPMGRPTTALQRYPR
jgi:hypothetical protein